MNDEKACGHDKQAEVEADKAAREGARHAAADLPEVGPDEIIVIDSDSDSDSEVELISMAGAADQSTSSNPDSDGYSVTENNPKRRKLRQTDAVELTGDLERALPRNSPQKPAVVPALRNSPASSSSSIPPPWTIAVDPISEPEPELVEWACATCTYVNHPQRVTCEMCFSNKPPRDGARPAASKPPIPKTAPRQKFGLERNVEQETWDCSVCGERGMLHDFWTCKFCGQVKVSS